MKTTRTQRNNNFIEQKQWFYLPCKCVLHFQWLIPLHEVVVLEKVARSLLSANCWIRGIKTHRFPWYLTLVSANHASINPGRESMTSRRNYHIFIIVVDYCMRLVMEKHLDSGFTVIPAKSRRVN